MKNWRTVGLVAITIAVFWFIKFYLRFPNADINIVGVILTVASVLFGFLAGFFISQLWTRYTETRQIQNVRSSEGVNMVRYASYFFKNKKFENEFKDLTERSAIVDEAIEPDEGALEIPYFKNIEKSFRHIKLKKNEKDQVYFGKLLDSYHAYVEGTIISDTLYKERLFLSEWFMMLALSIVISLSVLFLDTALFFYKAIVLLFPAIIALALSILYDLDQMTWGRELLTLEPNERILDALDVKRFYLKKDLQYKDPKIKCYRTEDNLVGGAKQAYLDIIKKRKQYSS